MALVTTPGSATADSYATVAEFDTYRANRLPAIAWAVTATTAQKEAALVMAARLLDALFTWTGAAVDDVQALAWFRSGMFTRNGFPIPTSGAASIQQPLKDAQSEFALQLGNTDLVSDDDALKSNLASVKAGSVAVSFKNLDTSTVEGLDMLIFRLNSEYFYLSKIVPDAVRQLLVPSWYEHIQTSSQRGTIFEAW